jgi:uncharacterized protein (TIGR02145 family)
MIRILFLMMVPFVCFSQITPREDILVNSVLKEKENLDTKRKASYNLDEIKVRWKKAALENCPGVPCVVAPSFTCGTSTVSDGDGNSYQTVGIGTQCWTKTNLKTTKYNDGVTPIPDLTLAGWPANTGARTVYGGSSPVTGYVDTYGYLYNWYAAAGIVSSGGSSTKNICPSGWHVPTNSDWNNLISFLGTNPGTQLKENSSLWTTPGSNTSGFTARPSGYRFNSGGSTDINSRVFFWESLGSYSSLDNTGNVTVSTWPRDTGASIRCLKDGI